MDFGKAFLAATVLISCSVPSAASDINSAASIGANAFSERVNAFPVGRNYDADQVLKQLNRVCASNTDFDRRRCAKAWGIINAAHAKLEAKRAAQGSAAD